MILGFTGSRHEPTDEQKRFIRRHIWDVTRRRATPRLLRG